jgi:hypothetical protein
MGPEQRVIDADTAHTLWNLVEELSPRQRTLLRTLFTDHPPPYTEVARTIGIPPDAIGPTRARALAQLRILLEQRQPSRGFPGTRRPFRARAGPDGDLWRAGCGANPHVRFGRAAWRNGPGVIPAPRSRSTPPRCGPGRRGRSVSRQTAH